MEPERFTIEYICDGCSRYFRDVPSMLKLVERYGAMCSPCRDEEQAERMYATQRRRGKEAYKPRRETRAMMQEVNR